MSAYCIFFQTALFFCVMYIRRTHTNNSSTGERYYTYRLVASQRVDGKPRQITLLNLGRHFAVDQDLWASLCVRIEQLLSHQTELLPLELPAAVDKAAQRFAAQLIALLNNSDLAFGEILWHHPGFHFTVTTLHALQAQ